MAENNSSAPLKTAEGEDERALFEAVASDHGLWPKAIERDAKGNYLLLTTANGWMWWQHARSIRTAPPQAAPAAVAVPDEREAYIDWLSGSHPRVFSKTDAEAYWRNEHVSALAWQARAALAPTPALPATEDSSAGDLAVVQAEPVADGEYLPLPMQYACSGPFPVYSAYQMREYADAHRKSATALQAEHMVPEGWREQFAQAVYADLAAADNQDVPLEEYPGRILKVLDSIVGPHHPTVVYWRNDAIRECIEIAKRYGAGTTAYQERDMAALYTAPQAQPTPKGAP